jgi:hypothetical protein
MHSKKLSAKNRRAIQARMTPAQREREDHAKLAILNDFRERHGLSIMTLQEAMGVA